MLGMKQIFQFIKKALLMIAGIGHGWRRSHRINTFQLEYIQNV